MTERTPEEIKERLTRGEARAVMAADWQGCLPTYYPQGKRTGRSRIMYPTLRNLLAADLIGFHPPRLTPLGLAVKSLLEKDTPRHG